MATIADVAQLAKVSKATVSRVINDLPVSEKTHQRVNEAMRRLNYQPNAQARSLTLKRTNLIGVVGPFVGGDFYGEILTGILGTISATDNFVTIYSGENTTNEEEVISRLLREKRIDGLIIMTPREIKTDVLRDYQDFPIVVVDGAIDSIHSVTVDSFEGGQIAAQHLIKLGHNRIAMITGPLTSLECTERVRGYKETLLSAGIEFKEEYFYKGNYDLDSGRAAMEYFLSLDPRPTAVFAANDWMAIGAIELLKERTIKVPEEIAVIGFDDIIVGAHMTPALTTVRQPICEMGKIGAKRLLDAIAKTEMYPSKTLLRCELIVRESCGGKGGPIE